MRIGSSLINAYSGMKTFEDASSVTANNVANVATSTFKSQTPVIQEMPSGGSTVSSIVKDDSQGPLTESVLAGGQFGLVEGSNVDLPKETVNSVIYRSAYEASAKMLKTSDEMVQRAIDIVA